MNRPSFPVSLASGLKIAARRRGWAAYVPCWILACLFVGAVTGYVAPSKIWNKDYSTGISIYSGLLTFNGILMAVGWSSFSKIYEIIGKGGFGDFLRRNDLLEMHILYVDLAQFSLVFSTFTCAAAMVLTAMPVIDVLNRVALTLSVGATLYAIVKCVGLTQAMHDLIWESTIHDDPRDHK